MFRPSFLLIAYAALVAPPLCAAAAVQTGPTSPSPSSALPASPGAMFGARESVTNLDISPSGRYIVYAAPVRGTAAVAMVVDLEGLRRAVPIVHSTGQPERLEWCRFVNDTRLICSVHGLAAGAQGLTPFSRLVAINADGSNIQQLGEQPSFNDARIRQFDGAILDWLPQDGHAVLMSRDYVPAGFVTGTHMARRSDGLGVDRVDIDNLRVTRVQPANPRAASYMTDGRGNVRIMEAPQTRPNGDLTSRTDYLYRLAGSGGWRTFSRVDSATGEGMVPVAIDADRNAAYVLRKRDGRDALYRVRLDESLAEELVYANPNVDVDGVVRIGRGEAAIGVTFAEEQRRIVWFDQEYAALAQSLSRALPQLPIISFIGSSRDRNKLLIFAGSDSDPGRYYVYDKTQRSLNELMLARPELEGTPLASVRAVSYPASDGVSIPAYLTLPPGRQDARNLPAIVLPHGGPSARDEWGFDWLAQFLANRGYAVLQPNYRGSAGYGDAWFAQNGFRGWATSIGDVTAGGRWLIAQGADANRLAIVGWSYGGYAALQSGATEPSLFKAIVAIAPVTDLRLLTLQAEGFTNFQLVREFVGTGPHLDEGSPLRNVGRITAPVLLFHGSRDFNVDVRHSRQMDGALRTAGKRSELIVFPGLEHDLADSSARAQMLTRIDAFLSAELGGH